MAKGQKRLPNTKNFRNGVKSPPRPPAPPKLNKRAKGLVNFVKGVESNADAARDDERIGRRPKGRGMSMNVKDISSRGSRATGRAMNQSSTKRRGGLSMAGMGDHKHPEAQARAKAYGTKIVRVQKAMDNFARLTKTPKPEPGTFTHAHAEAYKKRMTRLKQRRDSKGRFA